jgi:hypothetical protein
MDPVQFDGVVRTLGQARSRRQAMRSLMGAAGALALGVRRASAQDEDCKANGKACKKNSQCCSGNCGPGTGQGPLPGACAPACPALPACAGGTPSCDPDCFDSSLCCSNAMLCDPGVCTCL